jgi:hypothetical protein
MFRSSAKARLRPARIAAVVLASLLVPGCSGISLPRFGSDSAVSTRVCGVYIDGKTRAAHLRIELVPTGLPHGALIEVEFENPADRAKPLWVRHIFTGEQQTVVVFSPPLKEVRPRGYEVVARIYASADKKQALGVHTQICQSLIDQRELVYVATRSRRS